MKDLKWFNAHIGKRIYRDDDYCGCRTCQDVVDKGLVVRDGEHARYLFEIQNDFYAEDVKLNYRDIK